MLLPNGLLRPRVLVLALWITAVLIWLTFIGPPAELPFSETRHRLIGAAFNLATGPRPVSLKEHPIKALHRQAEIEFEELLARQSKTFKAAASEYLRRYHRHPPPGFKGWYEFAVKHNSPIIDEFDIIDESLAPFWNLSGVEVRRRLAGVRESNGPFLQHCESVGGQLSDGCQALGPELLPWLEEAGVWSLLPLGWGLMISDMDEPRILPSNGVDAAAEGDGFAAGDEKVVWTEQSHMRVCDNFTAACDFGSDSAKSKTSVSSAMANAKKSQEDLTLGFFDAGNPNTRDLCQHPEYSRLHGLWASPASLYTIRTPVPIFSAAVLSTMGDIPVPAPAYTNGKFAYDEFDDLAWENKTAGVYWAGSTTGSFQSVAHQDWKRHHRQRFVALVNELGADRRYTYLARSASASPGHHDADDVVDGDGTTTTTAAAAAWQVRKSSALKASLYRVHFTGIVQCADDATETAIREYFPMHGQDPKNEPFRYTLAFDLDGNGHSGRFYRLLSSRSLPLKQTVFKEWHDERLKPWLHYAPVSLGMEELPEVVRYLADEAEGREVAALMAEEGRRWSGRALRPVDQAVYLFRLLLELGRLQDEGRVAAG